MTARAVGGIFKGPRYFTETIAQMDAIGVGSLTIIMLTGFFTGGVLTIQTFPTLAFWGQQGQTGRLVAVSLVRELGPVLTALMVTGRVSNCGGTRVDDRLAADRRHARARYRSDSKTGGSAHARAVDRPSLTDGDC